MDHFCDLHGTPDTPVSRIVTVKVAKIIDFQALVDNETENTSIH